MSEHPILSLYFAECESGTATQRSVAILYALIIAATPESLGSDWRTINEASNSAFGFSVPADVRKVDRFRKMAWDIHDRAAGRQQATRPSVQHDMPRAVQ